MKKNDEYNIEELANISFALIDFAKAVDNMDSMLSDAVSSGVESGRLLGLIEAYDYLVAKGFVKASDSLKQHLDDLYPPSPMAKA